jgi:hypothetical protein
MNSFYYIINQIILTHISEAGGSGIVDTHSCHTFMYYVRQTPGYWPLRIFPEIPQESIVSIQEFPLPFNAQVFFETPPSRSDFFTRYIEQGIHPAMIEEAYRSPMPLSDEELEAFFQEARAYKETLCNSDRPYPFQIDGIMYEDVAEFKAAKAYFYYEASQYI